MLPKVSILIPCYNADRWIDSAIESALSQTYPHIEVIVVDDGSSDRSLEIIQSYGDLIRWETQPNRGGNAARNRLLELSTGEWLQYLDADDYLQPNKVADQVAQIADSDIIYSPSIFEFWDSQPPRQEIVPIPEPHDPWVLLARWYLPQTGSPLWKKSAIVEVGGWKIDQPCCQEHELYLRLLKAGKRFQYCSTAGSIYRQWSETTVCKKDKSEVFRQRFAILDAAEAHLQSTRELTALRQNAINQARFECARTIWLSDRAWANQVIAKIKRIDRSFIPTGQAAPRNYQWIYQRFGFAIAERIAHLRRTLTPNPS
ncbi:glycosyltransferase [Leptolyngbya sp. AN03gr2]